MSTGDPREVRPVASLADLNARNRDLYPSPPLPQRRKDGTVIDEKFPHREDKFPCR